MYKGRKALGSLIKCDNHGDGLYSLMGRSRALAKQAMHQVVRRRLKSNTRKEVLLCSEEKE